ncbi:hypothetical protein GYMLUDRAFT_51164 [Collybiopsis luxurians FD-317 M1]|uniref:Unplaced genomic scaffold GYMLUscaffold_153, whole genome shotgun sequence n=1 Tax=Collybiopsis luxurians FD-317 M1 TaxID=944289 RepID=A0A0D0B8J8_9AGAR|nr:hypothetical protein GYMLUDRAFT_51164 [Collybiopsis luxurians FD-317 M1]
MQNSKFDSSEADHLVPIAGPSTSKILMMSDPAQILPGAAATRKKKLEDDPWTADVSIHSVKCLSCGHRVRLSTKSLFDNHHWNKHKARCLKTDKIKDHNRSSSTLNKPPRLIQIHRAPRRRKAPQAKPKPTGKPKRASSVSSSISSLTPISTPPLTSDNEDDLDLYSADESEPAPPRPISIPISASRKRDVLTEQYFARAHGIQIRLPPVFPAPDRTSTGSSDSSSSFDDMYSDNWRAWDWSQLRMADFSDPDLDLDDGGSIVAGAGVGVKAHDDDDHHPLLRVDLNERILRSGPPRSTAQPQESPSGAAGPPQAS